MRYLRASALLSAAICSLFIIAAGFSQTEYYLGTTAFISDQPGKDSSDNEKLFTLVPSGQDFLIKTVHPQQELFTAIGRMTASATIESCLTIEGEDSKRRGIIVRLQMLNRNHHFITSSSGAPIDVKFYQDTEVIVSAQLKYRLALNERYGQIVYNLQSDSLEMVDSKKFRGINKVTVVFPAHAVMVYYHHASEPPTDN